ncbi:MAG: hypothetical protein ACP5Q1_02695 [Anaerolineae bacterium]
MVARIKVNHKRCISAMSSHGLVLGVFLVLSLILTYPLVSDLGTKILGPPAPGDNFQYVHRVWWFKYSLFDAHISPFFNPNMFYPFGYHITLSETTLSNTILALPLTLLFGEVVAYNLILLVSFVLSGFAMYLFVLQLTGNRISGLLGGVLFAFSPYRMSHLGAGHLPLMGTQWLPLLFLYLGKMVAQQRRRDAFMAGLFYSLGALSAWYYAYIFAVAGLLYVLLYGRPWRQNLWQRRFVRCVLVFVLVCLLLVGPFVVPVTQLWRGGERAQSLNYLDYFSASPLDFVYPNVMHPIWGPALLKQYPQNVYENILFLGWVPLFLTAIALWRQRDKTPRTFLWLSLIFGILALGTTLHWGSNRVYIATPAWLERIFTLGMGFLTKRLALYPISSYTLRVAGAVYVPLPTLLLVLYLPFFKAMRVWARFGLITNFGIAVLAGYGLQRLCERSVCLQTRSQARSGRWVMAVVVFGLVLLEFASFPYALGSSRVTARPVDLWLQHQDGDFAIMEFPVVKAISGLTLYATRVHGKKISFGCGTFLPAAFNRQRAVLDTFPSAESIALLKRWGVRYVLVGARNYGSEWARIKQELDRAPDLRYVIAMDDVPIYEGDRILHLLPGTERSFIVDRIYVYEVL